MTEPAASDISAPPSYARVPPKLIGGALCLDFVNTLSRRGNTADPGERLGDYQELLHWSRAAGLLGKAEARRLEHESAERPKVAAAVLAQSRVLREALARLLTKQARSRQADLGLLNEALARAPARDRLAADAGAYDWELDSRSEPLERPLWPVLWNACELLTSKDLERIGACSDETCRWLFLDLSRNRSRRWCSMEDCGNRAKARRHYARHGGA